MQPVKRIILGLLLIASISSCHKNHLLGIWGKGSNVTETRNITGFSGIDLSMNADVYYVQDSIYRVEVSAQKNILPVIETEIHGTVLEIECRTLLHSHNRIVVTIYSPDIDKFHVSGSGKLYAQNSINTGSLDVSLSGSGTISIHSITAQNLTCKISGSGDIHVMGGAVSSENFRISGSGDIEAVNVVANSSVVNISGSGDMTLQAVQNLDVTISGSGSVKYKGNPVVQTHISGSGKIVHIN